MNEIKVTLFEELSNITAGAIREKLHVTYYHFCNHAQISVFELHITQQSPT